MPSLGPRETRRVITAMREIGATSPAAARPKDTLPDEVRLDLEKYVNAGLVREGQPGTYYLFDHEDPWTTGRIAKLVLFWFLVLIIPVIFLQLSS